MNHKIGWILNRYLDNMEQITIAKHIVKKRDPIKDRKV